MAQIPRTQRLRQSSRADAHLGECNVGTAGVTGRGVAGRPPRRENKDKAARDGVGRRFRRGAGMGRRGF